MLAILAVGYLLSQTCVVKPGSEIIHYIFKIEIVLTPHKILQDKDRTGSIFLLLIHLWLPQLKQEGSGES